MKKILIYNNNFYPEISSLAQLYTDLSSELTKEFEVNVICAVPSYIGDVEKGYLKKWLFTEKYKGINIYRVRVLPFDKKKKISRCISIIGYFIYAIAALFKIGNVDVILAVSQPPILGGLLGVIAKIIKRRKLIYNIQDFNPEQIVAVGYSRNKILLNLLLTLDKISCRYADKVVVVGKDMVDTIYKRFDNKGKLFDIIFINNWVDEKKLYPLNMHHDKVRQFKQQYGLENKFIFMYSGNIGLIYDLENIIKVIGKFKEYKDIAFVFVGEGNVKEKLQDYVAIKRLTNVFFIPYQDNDKIIYSLNTADVHFVVNAKGMKGVACPSKLYGVMAVGKPVLGVLEKGTEARGIIEDSKCGYVTEPENYSEIEKLIIKMYTEKSKLSELGNNARAYLCDYLSREKSINKYRETLKKLIEDQI
ncbi:MAG: glycosyltransferase family 4 protein [Ruminococcus sp.]|nr:glycosyltransferase family 4 protein [Ruminococcus sp.]